jgi:hypothetical protein
MQQISSQRSPVDTYFGKRFVGPGFARRTGSDPACLDPLVRFVKKWGARLSNCTVTERGIDLSFYRGGGSSRYSYMPVDELEQILPDLVEVDRAMATLAAEGPARASASDEDSGRAPTEPSEPQTTRSEDLDELIRSQVTSAFKALRLFWTAVGLAFVWGLAAASVRMGRDTLVQGTILVIALLLAGLLNAQRMINRPIITRLAGRRPLGEAIWGQFAMSLIPLMGIILALEEAGRTRRGIFQIGEHDNEPERLGEELVPRTHFYYTLAALWPLAAIVLLLHVLLS